MTSGKPKVTSTIRGGWCLLTVFQSTDIIICKELNRHCLSLCMSHPWMSKPDTKQKVRISLLIKSNWNKLCKDRYYLSNKVAQGSAKKEKKANLLRNFKECSLKVS